MNVRRAIVIAACLLPVAAGSAAAQTASSAAPSAAPWPAPPQSAPAPWPGQQPAPAAAPATAPSAAPAPAPAPAPATAPSTAPWPTPQQQATPAPWQQPQQPPAICEQGFKLRAEAQKRANALQAAGKHKPSAQEACGLFNAFSAAEAKMIKFVTAHATECRVPKEAIDNMKQQHAQTNKIRSNVCRVASAPRGPAPPSLSDALSAPVPDSNNIKTGRGTFDTLTGNPLGR